MNMNKYDIIIPGWNMADFTVRCLQTIKENSSDYRVIYVDNGSDHEQLNKIWAVLKDMPHHLIANSQNLGFVQATNQGVKASDAPYVVFMNNDTEAVPGWLEKLVQPLEENPTVMLSGPLTTTERSWQGMYPKDKHGYAIRINGMLAFFCTMFKGSIFTKVGLLDECFGVGFGDDDDFCRRVIMAGYHMALVQDLVIPHHHRTTFNQIYGQPLVAAMQVEAMKKYKAKHNLK